MTKKAWGVYIHVPFCRRKCLYCDFPSCAGREDIMPRYVRALCAEICTEGAYYYSIWGTPRTIYIGGGTPTVLPMQLMAQILEALAATLGIDTTREFTIECNPGTANADYFAMLRDGGVNRISFGVQSFDDRFLRKIGRIHTADEARNAILAAKRAGIASISADLMYGLPEQTLANFIQDLHAVIATQVNHVSVYGLQVEDGTPFAKLAQEGKLALPSDETTEAMYDAMVSELPTHGYLRYEISNFARWGYESKHNLAYWSDIPYLGLGCAAHSYLDGVRYENPHDIDAYIHAVEHGEKLHKLSEPISRRIHMEEYAFLALRKTEGIKRVAFLQTFGIAIETIYGKVITQEKQRGLLEETETHVRLTPLGMKYGNEVFEAFLLDELDEITPS